jgi:hypothetical protein
LKEYIEYDGGGEQYHSGSESNAPVAEKLHEDHISTMKNRESQGLPWLGWYRAWRKSTD